MVEWWDAMTAIEQIFAAIGIAATVLLVIQMILLLIGMGDSGPDLDTDADTSGLDSDFDHPDSDLSDVTVDYDAASGDIYYHADMEPSNGDLSHDTVSHHTHSGDGLKLFTLQGIVAFFAIFGWTGVIMLKADVSAPLSIVLAFVFGFIAMTLMALLMRAMLKLQTDGSLDIKNALGKSGTVYLPIYPKRTKAGKVSIMVQERLAELDAVTDEEEKLPTGMEVTVIGISNRNTLIVRKK